LQVVDKACIGRDPLLCGGKYFFKNQTNKCEEQWKCTGIKLYDLVVIYLFGLFDMESFNLE
jgi:hypothetical protein